MWLHFKGVVLEDEGSFKGYILHDSFCIRVSKRQNGSDGKQNRDCQWVEVGERVTTKKQHEGILGCTGTFPYPNSCSLYVNLHMSKFTDLYIQRIQSHLSLKLKYNFYKRNYCKRISFWLHKELTETTDYLPDKPLRIYHVIF